MILSRFTKVVSGLKCDAIVDTINSNVIFVDKHTAEKIRSCEGKHFCNDSFAEELAPLVEAMSRYHMIVESSKQDDARLQAILASAVPSWSFMYLILTDKCNLSCKYCFMESGLLANRQERRMSWEVAQCALDKFIEQRDRSKLAQVWLYGGEPTLNQDTLFKVLDYLRENDPEIVPIMVTNGTLIDDELAASLSRYDNLSISVSIDGRRREHDANRVDRHGAGSYDRAVHGLRNLQRYGLRPSVSFTIGALQARDAANTAKWIVSNLGIGNFGINLLVDTDKDIVSDGYAREATLSLLDFFQYARQNGITESRIMRKVGAFVKHRPRINDCAACGNQIVIAPDGAIGVCHEGLGEVGQFTDSIMRDDYNFVDDVRVKKWANRTPFNNPECLDCEALGICGGGCPYGAKLRGGSIFDIDRRFCVHSKMIFEWLIWDLYSHVAG